MGVLSFATARDAAVEGASGVSMGEAIASGVCAATWRSREVENRVTGAGKGVVVSFGVGIEGSVVFPARRDDVGVDMAVGGLRRARCGLNRGIEGRGGKGSEMIGAGSSWMIGASKEGSREGNALTSAPFVGPRADCLPSSDLSSPIFCLRTRSPSSPGASFLVVTSASGTAAPQGISRGGLFAASDSPPSGASVFHLISLRTRSSKSFASASLSCKSSSSWVQSDVCLVLKRCTDMAGSRDS